MTAVLHRLRSSLLPGFISPEPTEIESWVGRRCIPESRTICCYPSDTCREFIRTTPSVQHDDKKPEDVDKKGEDHPQDGTRYVCMARPYKTTKKKKPPDWWTVPQVLTFNDVMKSSEKSGQWKPEII